MTPFVHARPNAAALIESMRDIGYSLPAAVADIIDNSITAKAKRIEVLTHFDGRDSAIGILDNGVGMTRGELIEAMRPGTRSPTEERAEDDLGRFGLGLKTASYSQCRRLTVSSRRAGVTCIARWDIDRVVAENDWMLETLEPGPEIRWLDRVGEQGTLVVWERLDRILGETFQGTESEFDAAIAEVEKHLALVFHRFIKGSHGARRTQILLNGTEVKGFDPFFSERSNLDPEEPFLIGDQRVNLRTYTLPHHSSVTPDEWSYYAGEEGYLKNQGFYVFRGNRLIIHGTWFGLMRQGELTKLSRVAVDLPNRLDDSWKIDVKKASAQPPPGLRRRLKALTERLSATSKRIFKHKGAKQTSKDAYPLWVRKQRHNTVSYVINEEHPVVVDFLESLDEETASHLRAFLAFASASLPLSALHHDVSANPENVIPGELSESDLFVTASSLAKGLLQRFKDPDVVREMIRSAEPFRSDWERTDLILRPLFEEWEADDV